MTERMQAEVELKFTRLPLPINIWLSLIFGRAQN